MAHATERRDWLRILRKAAKRGKEAILVNYTAFARTSVIGVGQGGDLTLRIDKVSETAIHDSLLEDLGSQERFVFVSEELGEVNGGNRDASLPVVICDPLDGSHNAQVGVPLFSISLCALGLEKIDHGGGRRTFGDVDVGVVASVPTEVEYFAIRGGGSFRNGDSISPNSGSRLEGTKIKTLGVECGDLDLLKQLIKNMTKNEIYKFRILGSAAMGFCMLAEGTYSGFIFAQPGGARTIDSPAGYLIAKETGRVMTDLSGKLVDLESTEVGFQSRLNVLGAADAQLHSKILSLVREP